MVHQPSSPIKNFSKRAVQVSGPSSAESEAGLSSLFGMAPKDNQKATSSTKPPAAPQSDPSSLGLSQVQTVQSMVSSQAASPEGKSRPKWRGVMITNMKKLTESNTDDAKPTMARSTLPISKPPGDDSPTDPAYDPKSKTLRLVDEESEPKLENMDNEDTMANEPTSKQPVVDSHDLPKMAITGSDEPQSFFDFDSDSSSDSEIVVHRASSVRVGKPNIVDYVSQGSQFNPRHKQKDMGFSYPKTSNSKLPEIRSHMKKSSEQSLAEEDIEMKILPGGPEDALRTLEANATERASTIAIAPTPSSEQRSSYTSNTESGIRPAEVTNTSIAFSSSSTAIEGFSTPVSTDGLRSNPLSDLERSHISRTISAPLFSHRRSERRVTIQPLDTNKSNTRGDRRHFRESVVSTPYPSDQSHRATLDKALPDEPQLSKTSTSVLKKSGILKERDRFPSPSGNEVLFLDLTLSRHPSAQVTVEIEVSDRSSYDDEAMFLQIQKSYNSKLLGFTRRVISARFLSHSTSADADLAFDGIAFVRHIQTPRLGHKMKTWLLWLRSQQPLPKRTGSARSSNDGHSFYSPASIPRMPFMKRKFEDLPPKVTLHHEFSALKITLGVLLTIFLSCLSIVLWVLFGLPGSKAGTTHHHMALGDMGWVHDAERRILVGLVLGMLVFLLGCMANLAWIAASWTLM